MADRILDQMVREIHACPELAGCVIGYHGVNESRVLHPGYSASLNSDRVIVIIELCQLDRQDNITELKSWADSPGGSPESAPNPTIVTNRSRLGPELIGVGLSCGLTAVSAVGVVGGAAAEVPTGGASTFLVIASWTGVVTGGIQCINGLARVGAIIANPDGNTLQQWDQDEVYKYSILVVDGLGVLSGVASLPFAARNLWAVLARQKSFVARGLTQESLRAMNRAERLKVIGEVVAEASKTPEGRNALIAAAREAGVGAKSIQSTAGLSVRHAATMTRIVGLETVKRLRGTLRDIVAANVGFGASASPDRYTGSASGSINWLINLIEPDPPAGSKPADKAAPKPVSQAVTH